MNGLDDDCDGPIDEEECTYSPILVDVEGNNFSLTDKAAGVFFDLSGDGEAELLSWTRPDSDDAWLTLDRNGNGIVDNGLELFGNFSEQSPAAVRHGFRALAEFDLLERGGNQDGQVSAEDSIYSALRLWRDGNHDGVSQTHELFTLSSVGIVGISLEYREANRRDRYGNAFRYRAKIISAKKSGVGHWAYDVFLVAR